MSRIETLRETLGGPHPRAATKVKPYMDDIIRGFIAHAPFAVMASADGDGNCDASPKGGLPGFIKVLDERRLLVPDIGGNRLFQSYHNFETNPKVGFVFMIPGVDSTARVNGRVELREPDVLSDMGIEPELNNADHNSGLIQGIVVHVDEAYLHCPRSFRFANLWDTDTIERNTGLTLTGMRDAARAAAGEVEPTPATAK